MCSEFASPLANKLAPNSAKPKHADTVAVAYDATNKTVTTVYADRSIYFWHLGDIKRISKLNSFFYHSSCIWDIEVLGDGLSLFFYRPVLMLSFVFLF